MADARFLILTAAASLGVFGTVWTMTPTTSTPAIAASAAAAPAAPAVYYPGCNAARAAGAAPLHRGEPGYRPEMDGDNDGIACEPHSGADNGRSGYPSGRRRRR